MSDEKASGSGGARYRKQKCTAKAKGTGARCRRWAVDGYDVCMVHGAGTSVRQTRPGPDGRVRKDPGTAAIKTGIYASRTETRFAEAMLEFRANRAELFDIEMMAARLWTALMTIDKVEGTFDLSQLLDDPPAEGVPPGIALCSCGNLYRKSDIAKDIINRVYAVRSIIHELLEATRVRNRLDERTGTNVSEAQLVAILVMIVQRVTEMAMDPSVERDEIPRLLVQWIDTTAKAAAGGTPDP